MDDPPKNLENFQIILTSFPVLNNISGIFPILYGQNAIIKKKNCSE